MILLTLASGNDNGNIPREIITLHHNNLTGKIPFQLGSLLGDSELWLGYSGFTSGIPSSFGNYSSEVAFRGWEVKFPLLRTHIAKASLSWRRYRERRLTDDFFKEGLGLQKFCEIADRMDARDRGQESFQDLDSQLQCAFPGRDFKASSTADKHVTEFTTDFTDLVSLLAVVIDDLGIGDGARVLDDGATDGINPVLLLLLGVGDEVHGVGPGGELEGVLLVEDVLGALDGEAGGDGDDAAGPGGTGDGGVLEPEELPLLQDEPAPPPRLYVLALLRQPAAALRSRPELHAAVVVRALRLARRGSPEARHWRSLGRGLGFGLDRKALNGRRSESGT
ncbi:hypothetical protein TIFTF001_010551 [Ficus carica]|uniref:Uncharacterized protein n=1 Tax=Ficus carica TaxID=3494 RepID=A0AA88ACF3_FICCA|nr:hypothetical protein TIFTF001_010551 [Ficus carica]